MQILKRSEVVKLVGLSPTTIWRMYKNGSFPAPIQLSSRRVGWDLDAVEEWVNRRRAVNGTLPSGNNKAKAEQSTFKF